MPAFPDTLEYLAEPNVLIFHFRIIIAEMVRSSAWESLATSSVSSAGVSENQTAAH